MDHGPSTGLPELFFDIIPNEIHVYVYHEALRYSISDTTIILSSPLFEIVGWGERNKFSYQK